MNGAHQEFEEFGEPPPSHFDPHAGPLETPEFAEHDIPPAPPQHTGPGGRQPRPDAPRERSAQPGNGATGQNGNGSRPGSRRTSSPDFSGLPPQMAESLAKLAGLPWPPRPDDMQFEPQNVGPQPKKPREG
jgi:hypothetical protein